MALLSRVTRFVARGRALRRRARRRRRPVADVVAAPGAAVAIEIDERRYRIAVRRRQRRLVVPFEREPDAVWITVIGDVGQEPFGEPAAGASA